MVAIPSVANAGPSQSRKKEKIMNLDYFVVVFVRITKCDPDSISKMEHDADTLLNVANVSSQSAERLEMIWIDT